MRRCLPSFVKLRTNWLAVLICLLALQSSASADAKVEAVLHTKESMQEHASDEPRRLMHDVLMEEFRKGKIVTIANTENAAFPVKYHKTRYLVGANLIAFSYDKNASTNVSLRMQLMEYSSGMVILTSDRALIISPRTIESGLKLHKQDFDKSEYGRAITDLTRSAVRLFEEKAQKLDP